jgi:hypothetical protein
MNMWPKIRRSPHEVIRKKHLKTLKDKRVRSIVGCQFYAEPMFEMEYYPYISTRPEYLEIYKRWILSMSPYPMPKDADLYRLRAGIFLEVPKDPPSNGDFIKANKYLLYLLVDILFPFIRNKVSWGLQYYDVPVERKNSDAVNRSMLNAANLAAQHMTEEIVKSEGYGLFITGFIDCFKVFFMSEIGSIQKTFPSEQAAFISVFENEWLRILPYSDDLYGFEVMPAFSLEDISRYLRLPFEDKRFRHLSETTTYRQVINYASGMATFKPVPDYHVRIYYRSELCKLFAPLITRQIRGIIKSGQFKLSEAELRASLEKELESIAADFEYFYATRKKIENGLEFAERPWIFPLRGQLVKLGHVSSQDEFPFTDYVQRKFRERIRKYFPKDISDERTTSLDDEVEMPWDGGDEERLETIVDEVARGRKNNDKNDIPQYDAQDASGNEVGWKIRTFAGIVGKGVSTLRRWDDVGIFPAKRYEIPSRTHGKVLYRYYIEEDIPKARKIAEEMEKRIRHQT